MLLTSQLLCKYIGYIRMGTVSSRTEIYMAYLYSIVNGLAPAKCTTTTQSMFCLETGFASSGKR